MNSRKSLNQQGIVAIVSVMLIILIITVITLSLATLTRRGLRQALDEQLSTQALYAAESGINDARAKIDSGALSSSITDCTSGAQDNINTNRTLGDNVRYTCVLVDQTPPTIVTDVTTTGVKTFLLKSSDSTKPITNMILTWKSTDASATQDFSPCAPSAGCFLPNTDWGAAGKIGLLRARLIPNTDTLTRDNLGNTIDIVAYPFASSEAGYGSSMDVSATRQKILYSTCSSNSCTVTVSGLYNSANTTSYPGSYYLQLYSYYDDINVTVTPQNNNSGITLKGAQITIDSTGAAADVLRRVRVTVPSKESIKFQNNFVNFPTASLGVGDELCKRFTSNASGSADSTDASTCPAF